MFYDYSFLYSVLSLHLKKKSVYSMRRLHIPFEKNKHISSSVRSYLQIKKSATNLFITFYTNDKVIYCCSAGKIGLKKKERR